MFLFGLKLMSNWKLGSKECFSETKLVCKYFGLITLSVSDYYIGSTDSRIRAQIILCSCWLSKHWALQGFHLEFSSCFQSPLKHIIQQVYAKLNQNKKKQSHCKKLFFLSSNFFKHGKVETYEEFYKFSLFFFLSRRAVPRLKKFKIL